MGACMSGGGQGGHQYYTSESYELQAVRRRPIHRSNLNDPQHHHQHHKKHKHKDKETNRQEGGLGGENQHHKKHKHKDKGKDKQKAVLGDGDQYRKKSHSQHQTSQYESYQQGESSQSYERERQKSIKKVEAYLDDQTKRAHQAVRENRKKERNKPPSSLPGSGSRVHTISTGNTIQVDYE